MVGMKATKPIATRGRFILLTTGETQFAEYGSYVTAKFPQQSAKTGAIGERV